MKKFFSKAKSKFRKSEVFDNLKGGVELFSERNICFFCHYDQDGLIEEYVVNLLKVLKNDHGCSIIFVSNSEKLAKGEFDKIEDIVVQGIVRSNVGYDFEAFKAGLYFVGQENLERFSKVLFVNDSFYGPMDNFTDLFEKMESYDLWGITDSIAPKYHLHSYFLVFEVNDKSLEFLSDFWRKYIILHRKSEIVEKYEVGLTQMAINFGLKLGSYINHEDVINKVKNLSDLDSVERDLEKEYILCKQEKFTIKIEDHKSLSLLMDKYKKNKMYNRMMLDVVDNPLLKNWYTLIKYYKCPIFKVRLLRDERFFKYHLFNHEIAIKNLYPSFNINLIRNHLRRVREWRI